MALFTDYWQLTQTLYTLRFTHPSVSESYLIPSHSFSDPFLLSSLFLYYTLIFVNWSNNTSQAWYSHRPQGGGPVTLAKPIRSSHSWNMSLEPKGRKTKTAGAAEPDQQQALLAPLARLPRRRSLPTPSSPGPGPVNQLRSRQPTLLRKSQRHFLLLLTKANLTNH